MEHRHDQQQNRAQRRDAHGGQILRQQDVGDHHRRSAGQLQKGAVIGGNAGQILVDEDHPGVQRGGAESQQNALCLRRPRQAGLRYAGDKYHTGQRKEYAEELSGCQPFLQKNGGDQRDKNGSHVVAEGGGRYGGVAVSFKQGDPVETHHRSGQQKQLPAAAEGGPVNGRMAEAGQQK